MNSINIILESNQPKEQAGFQLDYSTTDHIHVINQIIDKYAEYTKPLCMIFIDFGRAFDSVEIHQLW